MAPLAEVGQVPRDPWLGPAEGLVQVADADLAADEEANEAQAHLSWARKSSLPFFAQRPIYMKLRKVQLPEPVQLQLLLAGADAGPQG